MKASKTKARLLMVDGNEFMLLCFRDYLVSKGFQVTTAPTAEKALKLLPSVDPELIILDLAMPGMGGVGLLKAISSGDGVLRYPVLVFTAKPQMEDFCRGVGVDGFMLKTAYGGPLLEEVERILAKWRAKAKPPPAAPAPAIPVAPAAPPPPAGKHRILLAEDDEAWAKPLRRTWESAGHVVDTVTVGTLVLGQAAGTRPDVIVLKELLSARSGRAVAIAISEVTSLSHVPVVLYDNTGMLGHMETRPRGVTRVVNSPDPAGVAEAVLQVLAHLGQVKS